MTFPLARSLHAARARMGEGVARLLGSVLGGLRLRPEYEHLDLPITAVVAKKYDGQYTPHSVRNRKIWTEAAERLRQVRPDIAIQWIDDTHASLPLKHPEELARVIDEFASKVG